MKFKNNQSVSAMKTFPLVEIESVSIAPRTELISLPPIDIGTSEVESFTSYVSRIAREYYTSPYNLMEACVEKNPISQEYLGEIKYSPYRCKNINGLNAMSEIAVACIENATGRRDLIYTTLLPWKSLLKPNQMKQRRAWCPSCLQDNLENKSVVYEKLLWKIDVVKSCPIHETDLVTFCPQCKKTQVSLSGFSFPGFCSCCKIWLGEKVENSNIAKSSPLDLWTSSEIGKIIANSQKVGSDVRARIIFADAFRSLMEGSSYNSYASMRSITGFAIKTIKSLTYGEKPLSLKNLIRICSLFDCSPIDLLLGNQFTLKSINGKKKSRILVNPSKKPKPAPINQVLRVMEEKMKSSYGASLFILASNLNHDFESLYVISPEHCSKLDSLDYFWKHKSYIEPCKGYGFEDDKINNKFLSDMLLALQCLHQSGRELSETNIKKQLANKVCEISSQKFWLILRIAIYELGYM